MTKKIDLTNKRFGKLIANTDIGYIGNNPHRVWSCVCDCGNLVNVAGSNLRSGITSSCGCLQREKTSNANKKHGQAAKTKEYNVWCAMRGRCNNANSEDFALYGGRGIKVCSRWDKFEVFILDMGECPSGHSIDRIDVNKDYSPENCRWADTKTQARNKRNNRFIRVDFFVKTLAEWAELSGVNRNNIDKRIRRGWSPFEAIWGKCK